MILTQYLKENRHFLRFSAGIAVAQCSCQWPWQCVIVSASALTVSVAQYCRYNYDPTGVPTLRLKRLSSADEPANLEGPLDPMKGSPLVFFNFEKLVIESADRCRWNLLRRFRVRPECVNVSFPRGEIQLHDTFTRSRLLIFLYLL